MAGGFSSSSSYPSQSSPSLACKRSESDKERKKMRERQRRAMTAKIFNGLRRHGGYQLSHRADINQVLRELAKEAGWVVEADGTTYRNKLVSHCPSCGSTANSSTSTTPTSSAVIATACGAGECSTTTSPRFNDLAFFTYNNNDEGNAKLGAAFEADGFNSGGHQESDSLTLPFYMHNGLSTTTTTTTDLIVEGEVTMAFPSLRHSEMVTDFPRLTSS